MGTTPAEPRERPPIVAASLAEATGEVPAELPRHRHSLARDTVRASQEVRILLATAEVVAERGYAETSVAQIVKGAGVSTKTFYELYADKEGAFLAAYAAIDVVIARMRAAALEHDEPREMLRAGARCYLEQLASEPAFTRMLVIEARRRRAARPAPPRPGVRRLRRRLLRSRSSWRARAIPGCRRSTGRSSSPCSAGSTSWSSSTSSSARRRPSPTSCRPSRR